MSQRLHDQSEELKEAERRAAERAAEKEKAIEMEFDGMVTEG